MQGHHNSSKVLYLTPEHSSDPVVPAIMTAGWQVDVVHDLPSARDRLRDDEIGVGLARLDPDPRPWFEQGVGDLYQADESVPWLALVSQSDLGDARYSRDLRAAFCGFETIPEDFDRLAALLRFAVNLNIANKPSAGQAPETESEMVAASPQMLAVFRDIRKIAATEAPTLITGESGTGKELAAQAVHERSQRASGPFVAVNCAALPATLIHSELFGHEKGSFTGATARKIGCIEAANGGTLFLDEIGDLPLDLQVTMLRFLQEGTIQRVGSAKEFLVNVRVVAATNVDLEKQLQQGKFREDLYFRLNVLRLEMPPLRDRGEDVALLSQYFFEKFCAEGHRNLHGFSKDALERLSAHDWPGNVRELINRIRRAIVMCDGRLIKSADLGLLTVEQPKAILTLEEARAAAEIDAVQRALKRSRNNMTIAARQLGVSRPKLYRLVEKYDLNPRAA